MSFWNNIFGNLTARMDPPPMTARDWLPTPPDDLSEPIAHDAYRWEPQTPLVLDERVNPPTPTEFQGQEGDIVSGMWNDPLALLGRTRTHIDWNRQTAPGNQGEYVLPMRFQPPGARPSERVNTIALQQPVPDIPPRTIPLTSADPAAPRESIVIPGRPGVPSLGGGLAGTGRHEYRHGGFSNLVQAAGEAGVLPPMPGPMFSGLNWEREELPNIYEDRRLGHQSYRGVEFTPEETRFYERLLVELRRAADRTNAANVAQPFNAGRSRLEQARVRAQEEDANARRMREWVNPR
jgi:hypothetical protein